MAAPASTFYDYFNENMESLGLQAPATLYGTLATALASAKALEGVVEKFGPRVTVRELVLAGTRSEQLIVLGGVSAAFYLGAVVGSLAIATSRKMSGGLSLSDVLLYATSNRIHGATVRTTLQQHPKLYRGRSAPVFRRASTH